MSSPGGISNFGVKSTQRVDIDASEEARRVEGPQGVVPMGPVYTSGVTAATPSWFKVLTQALDLTQPYLAKILVAGSGVGGGPLVRVAENGHSMKFLEAGPPKRDWFCSVPLLHGAASDTGGVGYSPPMALAAYFVEHYEKNVQLNPDLKFHEDLLGIFYPRGQGPGGSGNNNANVAQMPSRATLEGVYNQTGKDPRFHPDRLNKYFARAQDTGAFRGLMETIGHVLTSGKLTKDGLARLTEEGWQEIRTADPFLLLQDKQLFEIVKHILLFTNNPKNVGLGDILMRWMTLFDTNNALNYGREGFTMMSTSVKASGERSSVYDRLQAVLKSRPDTMSIECDRKVHSLIFNDKGTRVEGMRVLKPHADVMKQRELIAALHEETPNLPPDKLDAHAKVLELAIADLRELEQNRLPEMVVERASAGYVLSAGAFEDPMILIRSGIGPKEVLDRLGIAPVGGVYREAVGRNLKDRAEITMLFHAKDKFALLDGLGLGKNPHDDKAMKLWNEKSGRGPYASNGVVASYQFKSDPSQKEPDIFAFFVPSPFRGYNPEYAQDAAKFPQTFTAILLDRNGNLISDDSRLMTPKEAEALRNRLGSVEPDPADPTHMRAKVNVNYQRPKPGENPPLYSAMQKMEALFAGAKGILTETVPGDPFKALDTGSIAGTLKSLTTLDLFPKYPDEDIRSTFDWFRAMNVPVYDRAGKERKLTVERLPLEGTADKDGKPLPDTKVKVSIDGQEMDAQQAAKVLGELTFFGGQKMTPENLRAQLTREFLIEYQFSQQWGHHANGTCSLGPHQGYNVVGNDFRVHGIENLWVVSASATPAAINPGEFVQLFFAAQGENAADIINTHLSAQEARTGVIRPFQSRLPTEMQAANGFGANLLLAIERAHGQVGDKQGVLTGPALKALVELQKKRGLVKEEVEIAEAIRDRAAKRGDGNTGILGALADDMRAAYQDQSWALSVWSTVRKAVSRATLDKRETLETLDGYYARQLQAERSKATNQRPVSEPVPT